AGRHGAAGRRPRSNWRPLLRLPRLAAGRLPGVRRGARLAGRAGPTRAGHLRGAADLRRLRRLGGDARPSRGGQDGRRADRPRLCAAVRLSADAAGTDDALDRLTAYLKSPDAYPRGHPGHEERPGEGAALALWKGHARVMARACLTRSWTRRPRRDGRRPGPTAGGGIRAPGR